MGRRSGLLRNRANRFLLRRQSALWSSGRNALLPTQDIPNHMDVFDLLSYKLEHFLGIRPRSMAPGAVFYEEDEPSLLSLVARKRDGATLCVSRWGDLFPVSAFENIMATKGFTESDCYALLLVLSRFGYLLEIDNRQRPRKDYFIFYYLVQLTSLKNGPLDADEAIRNHMLRFLLFELSIDDEAYRRFSIKGNQVQMATDSLGPVPFLEVIERVYEALQQIIVGEDDLLGTLKTYQTDIVKLLATPDGTTYRLPLGDRRHGLIYPDVFMQALTGDRKQVMEALISAVGADQTAESRFVSRLILMNYSFHVLGSRPQEISALQNHVQDEALFGKLLEALSIFRPPPLSRQSIQEERRCPVD